MQQPACGAAIIGDAGPVLGVLALYHACCGSFVWSVYNRRKSGLRTHAQVVVAIDDSRSMGENCCGSFALEAVTLICRAMARLEVGEMGVVSYGGSNSILPLHPLEKPFTDADGPGIMAQMKFSQVLSHLRPNVLLGRKMLCCEGQGRESSHNCTTRTSVLENHCVKHQALYKLYVAPLTIRAPNSSVAESHSLLKQA